MSFAKLAAESLTMDEGDTASARKDKLKKTLYTLAALGGVGALGGLAYSNWDKIKGALGSDSGTALRETKDFALNPLVHGAAAAVAPEIRNAAQAVKDKNITVDAAIKQIHGLPDKPPEDLAEKTKSLWAGGMRQDKLDAAAKLRSNGGVRALESTLHQPGATPAGAIPVKELVARINAAQAASNVQAASPAQQALLDSFTVRDPAAPAGKTPAGSPSPLAPLGKVTASPNEIADLLTRVNTNTRTVGMPNIGRALGRGLGVTGLSAGAQYLANNL